MARSAQILMASSLAVLLVTLTPASLAQCEELEQRVEQLTRQIEGLERQVELLQKKTAMVPTASAPSPAAATQQGRQVALELYATIDDLLAHDQIAEAKQALTTFNERYSGTRVAAWTRSLNRELAVVGKPAPADWSIEKWFQGQSDLKLDGEGATVIVFWESWCPHCRDEVPKLEAIYDNYHPQGLQVFGVTRITQSATEESVQSFIDESGVRYPIAKETGALAEYFGVQGIPAAAVVKNGTIVWRGHPQRLTDDLVKSWL